MDVHRLLRSLAVPVFLLLGPVAAGAIVADHTVVAAFEAIPDSVVSEIKSTCSIFYGHTSHGSQIVTGMDMIRDEDPLYDFNNGAGTLSLEEYGSDLGHNGDTAWAAVTRARLNEPGCDINMVVWSWCGGCSDNTEAGIDAYLNAMDALEEEYPGVAFIYMTGHLDGTGPSGTLYVMNNRIRAYCLAHDKTLFDFADIESYNPDGVYYPNGSDDCAWCSAWCASHPCPSCGDCAHSHCFNCYRKGKAFWWLMAATLGDTSTGIADGGPDALGGPRLVACAPNPFGGAATVTFSLPARVPVTLEVFNLRGERIASLVDRALDAGEHTAAWDGRDETGRRVGSGVYFYRLCAGGRADVRKAILLR
jgi:FlgD Ig-like domain